MIINLTGPLAREIGKLILLSALLAFTYNAFAPKGLPLVPKTVVKEAVSDSALFGMKDSSGGDPANGASRQIHAPAKTDTGSKVIAPLHERALRNPDSMKAVVEAEKKKQIFRIISLDQFKRLRAEKRGMLIDARSAEDFSVSRIPGAKNIPGQEAEQHFNDVAELDRDTLIVIYCNNPDCHLGRFLAEFLGALEFKNMLLYDDGWDGWLAAKEPIDTVRFK